MKNYVDYIFNCSFKARLLTNNEIKKIKDGYCSSSKNEIVNKSVVKKRLPFVGKMFSDLNIDKHYWDDIVESYKNRNLKILEKLKSIFGKFEELNINKIFLYENFGALLASGNDISQFASDDIDLFASFKEKNRIEEALSKCGFHLEKTVKTYKPINSIYRGSKEENIFSINVMWEPLSRNRIPFVIDIENCIEWDKLHLYGNTSIKLPEPTTLMYLCMLHISVHSYSREPDLKLYKDIEYLSKLNIDWEKLYRFAQRDKKEVRILTAAFLSRELIGIDIPDCLINKESYFRKRIRKLVSIVFDETNKTLKYNPTGLNLLKVEMYSDYNSILHGIGRTLVPPQSLIRSYFLNSSGNILAGYIEYLRNMILSCGRFH